MTGPLAGVRVLEAGGIGPVPFCAMMLADLGAEVIQVTRPDTPHSPYDVPGRGRQRVALDLRSAEGHDAAFALAQAADILIEGFRPGVMERLGLGPEDCLQRNPRLVYGRMTGWGQTGPRRRPPATTSTTSRSAACCVRSGGADEPPRPPLNLVGDFGGGAMMLAFGVLARSMRHELRPRPGHRRGDD